MPRPITTLLSIDASRVLRADVFAPGAKAEPLFCEQPRAGGGIADGVRQALALAPGCGRNVWVAGDEIWGQVLTIPAAAVAGLKDAELAAALAFEAEPLSGISSLNAALGFAAAPGGRVDGLKDFAAIALDASTRDDIQSVVKKAGGKLRGLTSLKNLPVAADPRTWAERSIPDLERVPSAIPVVGPAPEKTSPLRYWLMGTAIEAAVLAVCFYHHYWAARTELAAQTGIEQLRAPHRQLVELKTKNDAANIELKKLDEQNARAASIIENAAREAVFERERISSVLRSLAKDVPPNVAIIGIQSKDTQTLHVDGLSLDPTLADAFATRLEAALAPAGLHAQAFSKSAQNILAGGGPWKFTLQISRGLGHNRSAPTTAPLVTGDK